MDLKLKGQKAIITGATKRDRPCHSRYAGR